MHGEHPLGQADEQCGGPGGGPVRQQRPRRPRPPRRRPGACPRPAASARWRGPATRSSAGVADAVTEAAGTACSCQPDSTSRHGEQEHAGVPRPDDARRAQRAVGRDLGRRHQSVCRDVDTPDGEADVVAHEGGERGAGDGVGEERGQRRCGQRRRLEQGFGQPRPSRLFEHAHQVDVAQPQSVGRLGHEERRRPELGQDGPPVRRQRRRAHPRRPARRPAARRGCTRCRARCARPGAARPAHR